MDHGKTLYNNPISYIASFSVESRIAPETRGITPVETQHPHIASSVCAFCGH